MFNRWDVCEAYALFADLWGPNEYGARLHKLKYHNPYLCLETASPEVKQIYGRLVRKHERLYVAHCRYSRRRFGRETWPGTAHMWPTVKGWLDRHGLRHVMDCYA
jgi:hypothetical protein